MVLVIVKSRKHQPEQLAPCPPATQARITTEEGTPAEKMSPSERLVGKPVGYVLD